MKFLNKTLKILLIISSIMLINASTFVYEQKVENENVTKNVNLSTMALKISEIEENMLFNALDTYTGDLTGYAADCPLCSGKLACKADYVVTDGTETYVDETYGKVKIVAASSNLACGSIVKFESSRISDTPVIAIVLDRGVRGNAIDLLVKSEEIASTTIGRSTITYDVVRNGWE